MAKLRRAFIIIIFTAGLLFSWAASAGKARNRKLKGATGRGGIAAGRGGIAARYLNRDLKIRINSDRLEVRNKQQVALFTGNVVVKQGNITIRSRRLAARYDKKGRLSHLKCSGNVRLRKGGRRAVGAHLTFDNRKRILVLTGNPKVFSGKSVIRGKRIRFFLDSDRLLVDQPRGRLHLPKRKKEK